jgi:hypothetical protein
MRELDKLTLCVSKFLRIGLRSHNRASQVLDGFFCNHGFLLGGLAINFIVGEQPLWLKLLILLPGCEVVFALARLVCRFPDVQLGKES